MFFLWASQNCLIIVSVPNPGRSILSHLEHHSVDRSYRDVLVSSILLPLSWPNTLYSFQRVPSVMSNPNRPDLPSDTLWYARAVLMGGLACWMTFGEHQIDVFCCDDSLLINTANNSQELFVLSVYRPCSSSLRNLPNAGPSETRRSSCLRLHCSRSRYRPLRCIRGITSWNSSITATILVVLWPGDEHSLEVHTLPRPTRSAR